MTERDPSKSTDISEAEIVDLFERAKRVAGGAEIHSILGMGACVWDAFTVHARAHDAKSRSLLAKLIEIDCQRLRAFIAGTSLREARALRVEERRTLMKELQDALTSK